MSLKKTVEVSENRRLREDLDAANKRATAAEHQAEIAVSSLERSRKIVTPHKLKTAKAHSKGDFVEVVVGDIHGNQADPLAMAAFLADLKMIQPDRLILGGDIINCGGFLAEHHTLGYVSESADSYFDDIAQTNHWLDEIENAAQPTERLYIEGNHEHRVERWVLGQKLAHHKDIEFLRRQFAPELVLNLKARGYDYFKRDTVYDTCGVPGWVKRDGVFFAHDMGLSKSAAAAALSRASANVVFFHTHRADFAATHLPGSGLITAWNPGCMCYDDQTDLLTDRGFIRFSELTPDDRVAEFDPWTRSLIYRHPLAYQKFKFKGNLLSFQSPRVNLVVTPEHRMLLTKSGSMFVRTAAETAKSNSCFKIPLAGIFVGENTEISTDEARLMGWIVTEGSLDNSCYAHRITIYQKKSPGVEQIKMLLNRLQIKFSRQKDKRTGVVGFRINAENSRDITGRLFAGGSIKRIPRELLRSPQNVLRAFFETAMAGDGCTVGKGSGYYATASEELANDFQELAHKIGYACAIKRRVADTEHKKDAVVFICGLRKFPDGELFNVKEPQRNHEVPYDGDVFDITTTTGFFMVRRGGKICISGNCKRQPLYMHTNPSGWTHGYLVRFISRKTGNFQTVHIIIDNGVSYGGAILHK